MKIIVSSEALAEKLKQLDLENDPIEAVVLGNKDSIMLVTKNTEVEISCEILKSQIAGNQHKRAWEKLAELVELIPEQAVILEIKTKSVKAIFDF